jgi:hypothetical protein
MAPDRSLLHRAVIGRLQDCAPAGAEPTGWVAETAGLDVEDVAQLFKGAVDLTVTSPIRCCGLVAARTSRQSRPGGLGKVAIPVRAGEATW